MEILREEQTLIISLNSKNLHPEQSIPVELHNNMIFDVAMVAVERMVVEFKDIKILKKKLVNFLMQYDKEVFGSVMSNSKIDNLARDVISIQCDGKNNLGAMYREVADEPIVRSYTFKARVPNSNDSARRANVEG
jgi:hypothetical protein